jgi:DNA-binding transcriptional MerR regulator
MRMAELSRRSGIPTATIKYYLREGLLAPGEASAPNQAEYGPEHLDRLSLIRALREAADLTITTISRVFTAMEASTGANPPEYLSIAVGALSEPLDVPAAEREEYARAEAEVAELLRLLGWDVDADSPGRVDLVRSLVAVHRHLPEVITDPRQLVPYGVAVRALAEVEIPETDDPAVAPAAVPRSSVLGTVLFEPVLLALRKLAHVDRIRATQPTSDRRRRRADRPAGASGWLL